MWAIATFFELPSAMWVNFTFFIFIISFQVRVFTVFFTYSLINATPIGIAIFCRIAYFFPTGRNESIFIFDKIRQDSTSIFHANSCQLLHSSPFQLLIILILVRQNEPNSTMSCACLTRFPILAVSPYSTDYPPFEVSQLATGEGLIVLHITLSGLLGQLWHWLHTITAFIVTLYHKRGFTLWIYYTISVRARPHTIERWLGEVYSVFPFEQSIHWWHRHGLFLSVN